MKFHMERSLRLHNTPEHKNLYSWAINEIDPQGKKIGRDQIPWASTLSFTATSVSVSDNLTIEPGLTIDKAGLEEVFISEVQTIRMQLRTGLPRVGQYYRYPPSFSMLGTNRIIQNFALQIHQLTDSTEKETCWASGFVSYTFEFDFKDETTDDCIEFHLSVKPETFARYSTKIADGIVDEILFSVSSVAGFYSEWSPSISTRNVKVLTRDEEHKVDIPPGVQLEPPRLGEVGGASLYINRRMELGLKVNGEEPDDDGEM